MKSRRSWLIGLALGAALFFGTPSAKAQTVPRGITYQGLLLQNGAPFSGNVTLDFVITDLANNKLFEQTSTGVVVTAGVFNVTLGDPAQFPAGIPNTILFDKQYQLIVTVNNGLPLPVQLFWSAPYALNSQRVGGLDVSPLPVNGDIFPMPLNKAGRIDTSMLPQIPDNSLVNAPITSINSTVLPNGVGNVNILGINGITITNSGNTVTVSGSSVSGGAITGVFGQNGVTGGGTAGNIYLQIGSGAITHGMIANGAISGQDITGIAGSGMTQDASGLLDVLVDGVTIGIQPFNNGNDLYVLPSGIGTVQLANGSVTGAKIAPNTITSANVNGTIQLAPISPAPAGSFLTSIAQSGATTSGTVLTNSTLTDVITPPVTGPNLTLGINLANPNTWTAQQNFSGSTSTIPVQISNSGGTALAVTLGLSTFTGITNVGTLTETGNETVSGTLTVAGNSAIGNTNTALLNSFGTGGNANSVINTFGSTGALSTNTFNGASTFTSTLSSVGNTTLGTGAGTTNTFGAGAGDLNTFGNATGTNTVVGTTNINTTGSDATTIGNLNAPLILLGSTDAITSATTNTVTVGTGYSLTTGTTWTGNVGTIYNLTTGTSANINTSGAGATNIGNVASTTTVTGPTNINTSGASTTTIGSLGNNALTINAATTHNGTTAFNNNVTQTAGSTQLLNTQVNGLLGSTGATTLATGAGLTNTFGTGTGAANTIGNASGTNTINGANSISGLTTYGTLGPDGNRVVINGAVSTPPIQSNQWELIVNGDAQITGTLSAGNFTASTITATTSMGAPLGMFDNLTTYTSANTSINVLKGLNVTGPISANGGLTSTTGTVAITGNESVSGNTTLTGNATVGGTLGVTGNTTLTTLTTSGAITDNSNNLTLGAGASQYQGTQIVSQGAIPGGTTPPASYVWTWPDKSGTVAMLSDIANISPPNADNETLYSTGAGSVASPYVWTPTLNVQNNGSSLFTVSAATTLQANGPVNVGGFLTTSSGIAMTGGPMNSQDITNIGVINTDKTWLSVLGLASTWTNTPFTPGPPLNPPTLPSVIPFPLNDFENVVQGDLEVTGTIYTAAEYATLNASQNLRFDIAEPFSQSGLNTMTFSGAATGSSATSVAPFGTPGTPVVTINNIPLNSYGLQVNAQANPAPAGGIQVTGTGVGTGVVIDPFPVGENVEATIDGIVVGQQNPGALAPAINASSVPAGAVSSPNTGVAVTANTTGETINLSSAPVGTQVGLAIGGTNAFITGETILAGTTGLTIGTAPTSINATGTINTSGTTGTGSLFTGSAPATYTLTVNNTGNGNNGTGLGLSIGGTVTSTGNSTLGTNSGTTNTFGNSSNTTNNIGNGGGTTANTIGAGASSNVIGQNAGTNSVGFNLAGGGTVINNIGADNTGSTVTNTIGGSNGAISSGSVTNYIYGATNINTGGTALTTVGNTGTDQIWEMINGINTAGVAAPPAIPGISPSQYELTDNGDAYIRGSVDAGQVTTGLLSAPNIAFNFATAYTPGNSMVFNGSGNTNPVVSIGTVAGTPVGNGQYGLQVTTNNATAAGGINITGSGAPVGMNVSGAVTGESITATTTGETIDGGSNGIKIGFTSAPTTAINVNSGSTTGMLITSPTGTGISLATMGGVTGVNYAGTTGTGFSASGTTGTGVLAVESGAGIGVQARVNGAAAYSGPAGTAAIAGLNSGNTAGVVGTNGGLAPLTYVGVLPIGVDGDNTISGGVGVVGLTNTAGASGIGVMGTALAATNTAGVLGNSGAGAGENYGVVGTTSTGAIPVSTITNASVLGFSQIAAQVGVGADNTANGGTALRAQANGGGNVTGVSVKTTTSGAGLNFTGSVPNSTGISVDVTAGATTGLYIKGAGGASSYVPSTGTGIYIDPVTEGIVAVATSIGAEFMPQTNNTGTGLNLGTSTGPFEWATGENVFAIGTGINVTANTTGISITSPASISANGTIVTTGQASSFGSTGAISGVGTAVTIQNNDVGSSALVVNGGIKQNAVAGGNQDGLDFNNTASSSTLDINGTASTWSISKTGVFTGTSFVGGIGNFTSATTTPALTTSNTGAQTANVTANLLQNFATTATAGIAKTGVAVVSTGGWGGAGSTNTGLSFNVSGGTSNFDVTGTGGAWSVTNAGAINSWGNATIATGNGGGSVTTNTFGSSANGSLNTISGRTIFDGTNQTTANLVTVQNVPNAAASWGVNITAATGTANNSQGIIATATSNLAPDNATAGSFNATGGGATNTALSLTTSGVSTVASIGANVSVTGASTGPGSTGGNRGAVIAVNSSNVQNIGEDVTVSGTNSTAIRVNPGMNTGISVDASNALTSTGELISGIRGTGLDLTFTSGINGVNGEVVDMTNATGAGAAYNGISVTNLNLASNDGIAIGFTSGGGGGTGLAITMGGNGSGSGIALSNVGTGSGIQVLGVSGAGYGLSVTGTSSSGNIISNVGNGGKGIIAFGGSDGAGSTALQVGSSGSNGGNVVSDGNGAGTLASPSNRFVDTYVLQASDYGALINSLRIYNSLITSSSTVIVTVEGKQSGTEGMVYVGNDAPQDATGFENGHFNVYTTAGNWGNTQATANVYKIHYMIVNH